MTDSIIRNTKRSEATKLLIQQKALEKGNQRSGEIRTRVEKTLKTIESEILANNGIYPENNGSLSGAEVARRANVHPTTFYSKKQRTLGQEVFRWLDNIKKERPATQGAVKKTLSRRIDEWAQLCSNLQQAYRDTELELQQAKADLIDSNNEMKRLTDENNRLRAALAKSSQGKISILYPNKH